MPHPYNNGEKNCCVTNDNLHQLYDKNDETCCNGQIINTSNQGCCNGNPYDLTTHSCCGNIYLYQLNSNYQCCNGNLFDPTPPNNQICCDGEVISNPNDPTSPRGCCNDKPYNKNEFDCCEVQMASTNGGFSNVIFENLTDINEFPGCRCEFKSWGEWNKCEDNFASSFQERSRVWRPKNNFNTAADACPIIPYKSRDSYLTERRTQFGDDWSDSCLFDSSYLLADQFFFQPKKYKDIVMVIDESTSIKTVNFEKVNICNSYYGRAYFFT